MNPGDIVKYIGPVASLFGAEAIVVAVNDPKISPGKYIALCFKEKHADLHTCDGLTPSDHGRWVIPDQLATPEEFKLVEERTQQHDEAMTTAAALVEAYLK